MADLVKPTYVNDGTFDRFIARDKANPTVFYRVSQGGHKGCVCDYVRVDETLHVTIHKIIVMNDNESFQYDPNPIDINVTWT